MFVCPARPARFIAKAPEASTVNSAADDLLLQQVAGEPQQGSLPMKIACRARAIYVIGHFRTFAGSHAHFCQLTIGNDLNHKYM